MSAPPTEQEQYEALQKRILQLKPKTVLADRVLTFYYFVQLFHIQNRNKNEGFAMDSLRDSMKGISDAHVDSVDGLHKVTFEIVPNETMLNPMGSVHGGCVATLFDNLSSYSLAVLDKYWTEFHPEEGEELFDYALNKFVPQFTKEMGVSRTLSVTYLRALLPGQKYLMTVEVVSVGRNFSHFTAIIRDGNNRLCNTMVHDKSMIIKSNI